MTISHFMSKQTQTFCISQFPFGILIYIKDKVLVPTTGQAKHLGFREPEE